MGKSQRYPHEYAKAHEHHGKQASREKRLAIRENSYSRECEQNRRRYRPEHLTWRNPLRNKTDGAAKINRLFEGKGSHTDAKKNAAGPSNRFR